MRRQRNRSGFVMLEVIAIVTIVVVLAAALYWMSGMEYRRVMARLAEDEAYYAAVSAVRMLEQEVVCGDCEDGTAAYELTSGKGMRKYETQMIFEEKDVAIPVTVWSEREEGDLLLAAEAVVRGKTKTVTLRLRRDYDYLEMMEEEKIGTATASDSVREESGRWVPVFYGVGTEEK